MNQREDWLSDRGVHRDVCWLSGPSVLLTAPGNSQESQEIKGVLGVLCKPAAATSFEVLLPQD